MKKELTIGLLTVALTIGLASTVTAQDTEESDVDVNVTEVTQLDVRPSQLTYGDAENVSIEPGDNATVSDGGYEHIELGNIGSTNIAEIYAEGTMPSDQPFGSEGLGSTNHNTANFVTVSTETANGAGYSNLDSGIANVQTMHYLNRVEYAEDTPPTYISVEEGTNLANSADDIHVGRIRAGGVEYFYVLYNEASGSAVGNGGDWTLRIGDSPHTSTQLGTVDFTDEGTDYTEYDESSSATRDAGDSYGGIEDHKFVTFNAGEGNYSGESLISDGDASIPGDVDLVDSQTRAYDLYAHADSADTTDAHILRSRFNIDPASPTGDTDPGPQTDGAQIPIFTTGTADNQLQPGDSFPVDVGIQVPQGIDQSRITEGTITILASETQ